jgi:prepilin-type N-terminal cleavage/methylation domain-containing protein
MTATPPAPRRGFTLIELLLAVSLMMIGLGIAIPFFLTQSRAVTASSGRLDAQLNANFALDAIDRDLRVAGVGITSRQPLIVYANSNALTFNADLTSNVSGDFGTVYYDPDAPDTEVGLLWPANKVTLPNSSGWTYPDSAYWKNTGVPSSAETITYWVESDPQASGLFRLMRRVNNGTARVLARGIKTISGDPFFRYFKLNSTGALTEIAQNQLPMRHLNGWHGSPADTGKSLQTDSIRLVRFKFTTVHRDPRVPDVTRVEERSVRITNAGLILASTCGDAPIQPTAVVATPDLTPSVVVTWTKSTDEGGGEKDVERYAIYRRVAGAVTFDEPIASVAAGTPPYSFTDTDVAPGQAWQYGVAALDCTPAISTIFTSANVVVP